MTAYVFPGQGSQFPGMGKDLYDADNNARIWFEHANDVLGFNLTDIMFKGTEEDLKQTKVTQPAIFLHSVVKAKVLGDAFKPAMVAGHSLGEFSALVAAGAMEFSDGLKLVAARANAMQKACELQPSKMAAILGMEDAKVEEICKTIPGVVQSRSLDEVASLVLRKQEMLASIPAVQPIPNEDLTATAGGYGMRIHPIHKIPKFHAGMDFTAKQGTPIHATGDGRVTFADYATNGYGMHVVVDHGFDYETLYAHLSELKVRNGQRVKRGDVIGLVGNTGLSAGPHLHYEVHKGGEAVDPANYYFNDLSPQEYARMLELSRNAGQSLD